VALASMPPSSYVLILRVFVAWLCCVAALDQKPASAQRLRCAGHDVRHDPAAAGQDAHQQAVGRGDWPAARADLVCRAAQPPRR
jgi:hypothetical protein